MDNKVKERLIEELVCQNEYNPVKKDILVVVRDQPAFTKACLESIYLGTDDFEVFVWDNGSTQETKELLKRYSDKHNNFHLFRSETNEGFIIPNNRLITKGSSPFVILLNNDCEVRSGWTETLIGYLQKHSNTAIVGYEGGLLSGRGMGVMPWKNECDYIMGWCLCIPRAVYNQIGLFDENNFSFAYCEDADLCLRVREAGFDVYALNVTYVKHEGNVTARTMGKETRLGEHFLANHKYFYERHKDYIDNHRILLKYPETDQPISENPQGTPEAVALAFQKY